MVPPIADGWGDGPLSKSVAALLVRGFAGRVGASLIKLLAR